MSATISPPRLKAKLEKLQIGIERAGNDAFVRAGENVTKRDRSSLTNGLRSPEFRREDQRQVQRVRRELVSRNGVEHADRNRIAVEPDRPARNQWDAIPEGREFGGLARARPIVQPVARRGDPPEYERNH
jgi:hypothetical protein